MFVSIFVRPLPSRLCSERVKIITHGRGSLHMDLSCILNLMFAEAEGRDSLMKTRMLEVRRRVVVLTCKK